jgi:hypothetical protein
MIVLRLLWANSGSSARAVRSHHGPMRAFRSAVILLTETYVGPHDSLMQQPTVCPMGQCVRMLVHDCFQAAVGHLELIGKDTAFTSWANMSLSLGSHPAHGKVCRPIRQPRAAAHCLPDGPLRANCLSITVHKKGPCECLRVIAFRLLWAN